MPTENVSVVAFRCWCDSPSSVKRDGNRQVIADEFHYFASLKGESMQVLRKLLEAGRYLLVLPVIGSLLLTVIVVVMGFGLILVRGWELIANLDFNEKLAKVISVAVIQAIDLFLVGALGYITAVGLYKLFISQKEEQLLKRIKIETLNDLESKIIGVVVAALAVSFLGSTVEKADPLSVFHTGIGIALVIGALCLFTKVTSAGK